MYRFDAVLWRWEAQGGWYFVTLPDDVSDAIAAHTEGTRRGFGSVRVEATVGASTWTTSVFPDARRAAFVLPVKRVVRTAEGLSEGSQVAVSLRPLDT